MAIRSFRPRSPKAIFDGVVPKGVSIALAKAGRRKLNMLEAAGALDDLKSPPGNGLHALTGDRKGQHAIKVNDQYRVCFRWTAAGPEDVEIVDYH